MSIPMNEFLPADGASERDGITAAAVYAAARTGAALMERSDRGRIVLAGADALDLLHRTTTADLAELAVGQFVTTVIQTETARILDWLLVWRRPADLFVVTGPGRGPEDLAWVDRMAIMDDVTGMDLEPGSELFELAGPTAATVLNRLDVWPGAGSESSDAAGHSGGSRCLEVTLAGVPVTLAQSRAADLPSFWLLVPRAGAEAVTTALDEAGATFLPAALAESLRLERGEPRVGRELTTAVMPLEARLQASIGFRKGCYPGQEVIARMITYKSVKRILSLIELASGIPAPESGESYPLAEGAAAGRITSLAWSPARQAPVAMGYLRNDLSEPGTSVTVSAPNGPVTGRVLAFPPEGTRWS